MTGLMAAMVAGGGIVLALIVIVALVVARRPFSRPPVDGSDAEALNAQAQIQADIDKGRFGSF